VLVPVEEWRRLQAARPSLKQLLLAPEARSDGLMPARGQARRRGVVTRNTGDFQGFGVELLNPFQSTQP
jgi:hypothetical protein